MTGHSFTRTQDRITIVEQTGSTNDDMLMRAARGEGSGEWLMAHRQISGRGRHNRPWLSPKGHLYASGILDLRPDDPPMQTLSFAIGLALFRTVNHFLCLSEGGMNIIDDVVRPRLKWPNDIYIDRRKLSGMLLQRQGSLLIAGIGVNITAPAPKVSGDIKAVSLHEFMSPALAASVDAYFFLRHLIEEVDKSLALWRTKGALYIMEDWLRESYPLGTALIVHYNQDKKNQAVGSFAGLNAQGALILQMANGEYREILAGDVSVRFEDKENRVSKNAISH